MTEIHNNIVINYNEKLFNIDEPINEKKGCKAYIYLKKYNLPHCNFFMISSTSKLYKSCEYISVQSIDINDYSKYDPKEKYTVELYSEHSIFNGVLNRKIVSEFPSKCLSDILIPVHASPYTNLYVRVLDSTGKEIESTYVYKCTIIDPELCKKLRQGNYEYSFVSSDILCRNGCIDPISFIEMDEESWLLMKQREIKENEEFMKSEEKKKQKFEKHIELQNMSRLNKLKYNLKKCFSKN